MGRHCAWVLGKAGCLGRRPNLWPVLRPFPAFQISLDVQMARNSESILDVALQLCIIETMKFTRAAHHEVLGDT